MRITKPFKTKLAGLICNDYKLWISDVFATGGRDGSLIIWDKRMPACGDLIEPYKVIKHSHEGKLFCQYLGIIRS